MTNWHPLVDISTMVLTAAEFVEVIEKGLEKRAWSLRKLSQLAGVPYSWLIDQQRNLPQKLDMGRAQKVLAAFERHEASEVKLPKLSETELALYEAMQGIIAAICGRGNKAEALEEFFTDQAQIFENQKQPAAAEVMSGLLSFLHSQLRTAAIPTPPQSLRRAQDQLERGKHPKN